MNVKSVFPVLAGLLVLVMSPLLASGQQSRQRPHRTTASRADPPRYLQVGVVATEQPAGTPNHRVYPALGGRSLGVAAAMGVFVSPKVALEGEVVLGGSITTPQRFSYNWFEDFTGQSRDVTAGVNARLRPTAHLELVGGGGVAFSTAAERSIQRTELPGRPTPSTRDPDRVDNQIQLTLNGGVGVPLPVSRRVTVVPAFAFRWIGRSGQATYLGVGSLAYQFGATVRFALD